MTRIYIYKLWNGGDDYVGEVTSITPFLGKYANFAEYSTLKQPYGITMKFIEVPIHLLISDNGVTITQTRVLDVRRKSPRQIKLILQNL